VRLPVSCAGAVCGLLLSLAAMARAAEPSFPSHAVDIGVDIAREGARVTERYALSGPVAAIPFEWLDQPCARVGPVAAAIDGVPWPLAVEAASKAPWTRLVTSAPAPGGRSLTLVYAVDAAGGAERIPIVLPAAPLERSGGSRGAAVSLGVSFASTVSDGAVVLPRLEPGTGSHAWHGVLLAMPSAVVVRSGASGSCAAGVPGPAGGLEWRTAIFAGTMALWVPVYLWWFSRRTRVDES